MAKKNIPVSKQLVFVLRFAFVIGSLVLYRSLPSPHWMILIGLLIGSVVLAEIIGVVWEKRVRSFTKGKMQEIPKMSVSHEKVRLSDQDLLYADVDSLTGSDFERLISLYYTDQGYAVQLVGGVGDHEVDLILTGKDGLRIAVQCKRWKRDVGNDIVLRLKAGKQIYGCYDAWIVTTSNFTKAAKEAAERLNIRLITGLMLHDKLHRWRKSRV